MHPTEQEYGHLIQGLEIDTSGHWSSWDWRKVSPITSYDHARLEEYRDSIVVAYRLYNRIGLEHARRVLRDAPTGARILDTGGGTGRKAIPLAQDGFTNITLLDHAPGWLRLADEKTRAAGLRDRIRSMVGDVRCMAEISDDSFDYVLALRGVMSYCGDPAAAIGEMARVLRPGGQLLANGIHNRLGSLHALARMGDLATLQRLADPAAPPPRVPVLLPEELAEMARRAGLTKISVGSEFAFIPHEAIRIDPETPQWEQIVVTLEMRYCNDPRFLGAGMLILQATRDPSARR